MKINSEVKVGLIGIATLAILIWGINYLKGKNILHGNYTLHAYFEDAGGMEISSPVYMQGIRIGYIDDIELLQELRKPVHVALHVENQYPVRRGSKAILYSTDVLGTRAVRIDPHASGAYLKHNDTIPAGIESDIFSSISDQVMPVMEHIGTLSQSLDSVVHKIDDLLASEATAGTLQNIRNLSASLASSLQTGGALNNSFKNLDSFSTMLKAQEEEFSSMGMHLNSISESVDSVGIEHIADNLAGAAGAFNQLLEQMNSGEGSMGKLVYSDSLYVQLQNLVAGLDSLITDLNENPQDYVHFSLFGKKQ